MLRASNNLYDASLAPIEAYFGLKTELVTVFSFTTDLSESETNSIFVISVHYIPNNVISGSFGLTFGSEKELVTVFSFTTDLSESKTIAIFVISAPNIPTVNFRSIKDVF